MRFKTRWTSKAFVALLLGCSPAFAGLQWEQREQSFSPKLGEKQVVAEYAFKNTGDRPVTLTPSGNDCDCTIAKLDKSTYAPGESGKIAATFLLGQRTGVQEKTILVTTDDPSQRQVALKLRVNLPQLAELSPRLVYWKQGESPTPKTICFKVLQEQPITLKGVSSTLPFAQTEVKPIVVGREYEITVTPTTTAKVQTAVLELQTDLPPRQAWGLRLYAKVVDNPAGATTRAASAGQ